MIGLKSLGNMIEKFTEVNVKERNRKGNYVSIVKNKKPGDMLEGASIVFLARDYGTEEESRFFSPGPSFLNIPEDKFEAIKEMALKVDEKISDKEVYLDDEIYMIAVKSKNNPDNTVVHWSVMSEDSPFVGLKSMFTIADSKKKEGQRYVIAERGYNNLTFNRAFFYRSERMAPTNLKSDGRETALPSKARWVNIVIDRTDAIGFLVQSEMIKMISDKLKDKTKAPS